MRVLRLLSALSVALVLTFGADYSVRADLAVFAEDPGIQSSQVTGPGVSLTTETFDGFSPQNSSSLSTAVGTISSAGEFAIVAANVYGGAGGTGNYIAVGAESGSAAPMTLALSAPQGYFGFWWSAADPYNQVSFYDSSSNLLGSFNTSFVLSALNALPNGSEYFGNPNGGGDSGEPFVYLNFVAYNGQTISSIVFANSGTTSTGFESDNWTISAIAPTGNLGTPINGGIVTPAPEPSSVSVVVAVCALCGLAGLSRRRSLRGACPQS